LLAASSLTNVYISCRVATLRCSHAYFSSILICNSQESWALHAISECSFF
jgi:hypothetical protein